MTVEEELSIELVKIDSDNVWDIVKLIVNDEQKSFVASNANSIIEAYVTTQDGGIALPFGLYENDIPIGFIMLGYGTTADEDEPQVAKDGYCLWRFMIDKAYQKQGLGGRALEKVLEYIRTYPCGPAAYCWLSYEPENSVAKALYEKYGFTENGEMCGEEIVSAKKL